MTQATPTYFPKEFENKTKTEQQKRFSQPVQTDGQLCNSQHRDRFYEKDLQIRLVGIRFDIVSVHRLLWKEKKKKEEKKELTVDMFTAPFKKCDAVGIPRRCYVKPSNLFIDNIEKQIILSCWRMIV